MHIRSFFVIFADEMKQTDDMSDITPRDTHGQAAVFAAVVTRMRPTLLATAMRYLHDTDDADDAVQEALMRCWMVRSRMHDPATDLPPMVQTVVRNVCIDHLRLRSGNLQSRPLSQHHIPVVYETWSKEYRRILRANLSTGEVRPRLQVRGLNAY